MEPTPQEVPKEEPKPEAAPSKEEFDLGRLIEKTLNESASVVREQVVKSLVEREQTRRVDLVVKGLELERKARIEARKADKPDTTQYDMQGNKIQSFTEAAQKARVDAQKHYETIRGALEKAINHGDYKKLEELVK